VEAVPEVQAVPPAGPAPGPAPSWGNPSGANNLDQLQAQLKARGVIVQRQEVTKDGVFVRCAIPGPDGQRTIEVTAPDAVAGLRAILAKLDQDQPR
jgi:hypothetical protein